MDGVRRVADTALATSKRDGHRAVLVFCGPYDSVMGMSQACYAGCLYEEGLLTARQLRPGHVACQPLGTGRGGLTGRASALAILGALEKHAAEGGTHVSMHIAEPELRATFIQVRQEFGARPAAVSAPEPLPTSLRPACRRPAGQCCIL